ncbi:hypothetical protein [Vibrio harveyi]|uniref:Restriction alleviation protein, Lar family n=1 Tax=Vibrio harveyi TaxID=669 RepID=A0A8B3DIT1_VIBHA|nr:hypothetical protein [Vibrio harveyi]RIW16549.1 hypothetical protein DS957_006490 [Vibrio harveyi]
MKFKKCPFCGSAHLSVEEKASAWNNEDLEEHVICNDCASAAPVYIWNIRTLEQESGSTSE